jgi:spore coat protein H
MRQGIKSACLLFFLLSLIGTNSYNQVIKEDLSYPEFHNRGMTIENVILLNIPETEVDELRSTSGEKVNIATRRMIINGDTLNPKEISTRGQTTLMYKRKSLSIKLKSKAKFRHGDRKESLKKFSLLSLSMDRYYCRNRLAFEMMDSLGIFDLFYSFCELKINGNSEGVFMIVERPEDWAMKGKQSPLVIRRGYDHRMEETKTGNKSNRSETRKYLGYYRQIYKSLHDYEGEELYRVLQEYIDIDFYMRWLAFNFLVHNGDYSDEVFFYIDPEIGKYRIIPWDYDDIFATTPHEGVKQRDKAIGEKLIFSSEDLLDITIANDSYLYGVYKQQLKEVLETLSPDLFKKIIERTYAELYPYCSEREIISNCQYDHFKDANLGNLQVYLSEIYLSLCGLRRSYLEYLVSDRGIKE